MASLYLNSPTLSTKSFGLENPVLYNNFPLYKFEFVVRIIINPVSGKDTRMGEALTFIIKHVDLPSITMQTETMNEYNRSRLVYTKTNYSDCNIVLHDVADGKVLRFWQDYFGYYVADSRSFGYGVDTSFIQDNNRRYMIDKIEIFQFHAGKANKTTLMYPKIIQFKPETLSYEELSGLSQITMAFRPEYVQYDIGAVTLPDYVRSEMRSGMALEVFNQSISTIINAQDPAALKEQVANELATTMARDMNNKVINRTQGAFGQTATVLTQTQGTNGSSVASIGNFGNLGITVPVPTKTLPTNSGGAAKVSPPKLGNVNSSNQQAGR